MKTACPIHFQNESVEVWIDQTLMELLASLLGERPGTDAAKFATRRWLGKAVRKRFGHILQPGQPVEEWARICLLDAVIAGKGL